MEIQDLISGKMSGRKTADEITVFNNNTGAGLQFAGVGASVLRTGETNGFGKGIAYRMVPRIGITLGRRTC